MTGKTHGLLTTSLHPITARQADEHRSFTTKYTNHTNLFSRKGAKSAKIVNHGWTRMDTDKKTKAEIGKAENRNQTISQSAKLGAVGPHRAKGEGRSSVSVGPRSGARSAKRKAQFNHGFP